VCIGISACYRQHEEREIARSRELRRKKPRFRTITPSTSNPTRALLCSYLASPSSPSLPTTLTGSAHPNQTPQSEARPRNDTVQISNLQSRISNPGISWAQHSHQPSIPAHNRNRSAYAYLPSAVRAAGIQEATLLSQRYSAWDAMQCKAWIGAD
jgi:hypothetical protein